MVGTDEAHKNVSTADNARARRGTRQYCAGCGATVSENTPTCWRCGRYFDARANTSWRIYDSYYRIPALIDHRVASPGKRVYAAVLDMTIICSLVLAFEYACLIALQIPRVSLDAVATAFLMFACALPALYFSIFECSSWSATPGKRFAGIKVVDLSGRSITFGAALRRHASKWLLFWPSFVLTATAAFAPLPETVSNAILSAAVVLPGAFYLVDVLFSQRNKDNRSQLDKLSGTLIARSANR